MLEKRPYEEEAVPWISMLLFEVMAWLNVVVPLTVKLPDMVALLVTSRLAREGGGGRYRQSLGVYFLGVHGY